MMEKSNLCQHPKFHSDKASDHNDNSHSDDGYKFPDMSISSSFCFDSNDKHILEEAYDEIIGSASLFQEETNNNHLDDKHNIGSNADGPTVDGTPFQPPQWCLHAHHGLHIWLHMMIWFKTKLSSSLST